MTEPTSAIQTYLGDQRTDLSRFEPYAQLVKMLVPSSGCIAIYEPSGDLLWCSDGFERPDFRELVDALKAENGVPETAAGEVRQTSNGVSAYAAVLRIGAGGPLGYVVVQLAAPRSDTKGSMAPSLLRPVLECLAERIGLGRVATRPEPQQSDDLQFLLALDDQNTDESGALQRLVAHCVESLDCVSGAFLVPEKNLSIIANRVAAQSDEARLLLDRTQRHLLAWAQLNNRPMVVNRVGAEGGGAPYKILSCPARDPQNRVTGLLALFRSGDAPNFEVRDVRILEYVSRKAIGILNSQHDALTGLVNPLIFERRVRKLLDMESPHAQAMLYLDIDRLQLINDAFGFHAGDEVIQRLAELIRNRLGGDDLACRIGGDRFAVFMPACDETAAHEVAESLLRAMTNLGYMNGSDAVPVSVSTGLVSTNRTHRDFDHLMAAAEIACKRAQDSGRNRLEVYIHDGAVSPRRESELVAAASLKQALQSNEFRLQAQPVVDLFHTPGTVLGYEILVRMRDLEGALISPDKFVAAAERYGLMPALDKWVVSTVIKTLQTCQDQLRQLPLGVTINVSAQTLAHDFPAFVLEQIAAAELPPELFCFELKESAAVNSIQDAERFIRALTEAGCHISLDDFGSGLSSLAHLKRLKVSYLKIDGSLVRRVVDDIHAESLVRGLAKAAQTLGVLTVAEHVESEAIARKLQQLEVDLAQGYFYGHPTPLAQVFGNSDARVVAAHGQS
jgi:diguanylate cyclase (GGDEF)-like protein